MATLQLQLSLRTGHVGTPVAPPAAASGLLFVLSPFPHTLAAVDPAAPAARRIRWQYAPAADTRAAGLSCCNREFHGPVVSEGRVFFSTLDGRVVALHAATGAVSFDVQVASPAAGETLTGPPLVADGRVFVGSAGDDFGVRGWVAALDAASGKPLWRFFNTGPDQDVGICRPWPACRGGTPQFRPFYPQLRTSDLGAATWPNAAWRQGGGGVPEPLLYDHQAKAVLHATGHAAPWNPAQRAGANRWTSGLFRRDAATGAASWFVGFKAGNADAFHTSGSGGLMELPWNGHPRRVVVHPDGNGLLYVVDSDSGEILAADAITPSTVAQVDMASGETHALPTKALAVNRQTRNVCPAWTGAFGSAAGQLDHAGLVALPVSLLCMDIEPRQANHVPGTPYIGANVRLLLKPPNAGAVVGWDVARRQAAWRVQERWPVLGGTLATAEGLVVYGTLDGRLKALDGRNGRLLWQYQATSAIVSTPVVFSGSDGQPYLAVVAGAARLHGMTRTTALDERDAGAGLGLAGLLGLIDRLSGLPRHADSSSTLLVFRLP